MSRSHTKESLALAKVKTCRGCQYANDSGREISIALEDALISSNLEETLMEKASSRRLYHHPFEVNVARCPNACSRPQIADVSIVVLKKPKSTEQECYMCGLCEEECREEAVDYTEGYPVFNWEQCIACGDCIDVCPSQAIDTEDVTYQLSIAGRLGRHPKFATEIGRTRSISTLQQWVKNTALFYRDNIKGEERFYTVADRFNIQLLKEIIIKDTD